MPSKKRDNDIEFAPYFMKETQLLAKTLSKSLSTKSLSTKSLSTSKTNLLLFHASSIQETHYTTHTDVTSRLEKWLTTIESLEFDQDLSDHNCLGRASLTNALQEAFATSISDEWKCALHQIDGAISEYAELLHESKCAKPLLPNSIKYILHLIPVFSNHKPSVSIDADTGYFTAMFNSTAQGLMTVLVTNKGELHFSLAERGKKLVKISGTAKIKDPHDLKKFSKVLSML